MQCYVDILTTGGTVTIDVVASIDEGVFSPETAGESIDAVARSIRNGNAMLNERGDRALVLPGPGVLALTYRTI